MALALVSGKNQEMPTFFCVLITVTGICIFMTTVAQVQAQNPTPCINAIASISPCIGFLTGSGSSSPTSVCCDALATAVSSAANCLCQLLGTNNPLGFPLDQTRVLVLPGLCNVNIPGLDECSEVAVPFLPPSESPAPAPAPDSDVSETENNHGASPSKSNENNTAFMSNGGDGGVVILPSTVGIIALLLLVTIYFDF